jgi:hypothetical protein
LKNAYSQPGLGNACVLEQKILIKPIGKLNEIGREILLGLFWEQVGRGVQDS